MTGFVVDSTHLTICSCSGCDGDSSGPEYFLKENESSSANYTFDADAGTITFYVPGAEGSSYSVVVGSELVEITNTQNPDDTQTVSRGEALKALLEKHVEATSQPSEDVPQDEGQEEEAETPEETVQDTQVDDAPQQVVDGESADTLAGGGVVESEFDEIDAQYLAMPGGAPDYVKSLFGNDNAVWSDAGPGTAAFGNAATAIYTFDDVAWGNPYGWGSEAAFDASQIAATNAAMNMWSNVSNFTFQAGNAGNAQIAFREYNLPAGAGVAVSWKSDDDADGNSDRIGQVEVSPDNSLSDFTMGSWGWVTMMHEVGHSIGAKHPGNYNAGGGGAVGPFLTDFGLIDSRDFSVMSYNAGVYTGGSNNPTGLMLYDIALAQFLYGVDTGYNSGNTTYTLTTGSGILARWDGGGTDTLDASGYGSGATLDLREGEAYVTHVGNSHTWNAWGSNLENATGGNGADTLYGNSLDNTLTGGGGNDTLNGSTGDDSLLGGVGADTYMFGNNDGTNIVDDSDGDGVINIGGDVVNGLATDAGGGNYTITKGGTVFTMSDAGGDLLITTSDGATTVTLRNYISGNFNITINGLGGNVITGTNTANTINDTTARDTINALAGNDTIRSRTGADIINAGDGDDRIYAYDTGATVNGEGGNDRVYLYGDEGTADLGDGDDWIASPYADATITGGAGADTINMDGDDSTATGDDGNDRIYMRGDNATVDGGTGNDYIRNIGDSQLIDAGDGDDEIWSYGTNATVNAGAGNDIIEVGAAGAVLNGDAGNDTITLTVAGATANGGADDDYLVTKKVSGTLNGDDGNDTLMAGTKDDTLNGGAGDDEVYGNSGNDSITGGDGNDLLRGQYGNDTLEGGAGSDTLRGGRGDDLFTGGGDDDLFIFDANAGTDRITDFSVGTDMLQYAVKSIGDATALASATDVGADVHFSLYGTTVVVENVNIADLDGQDFIL